MTTENKMKIYFAHSMEDYDTKREKIALKFLGETFKKDNIINPNTDLFFGSNMGGYLGYIRDNVDILVFMSKENNLCGKGTYTEIVEAMNKEILIYKIVFKKKKITHLTKDFSFGEGNENDWKNYIKIEE